MIDPTPPHVDVPGLVAQLVVALLAIPVATAVILLDALGHLLSLIGAA